MLIVVRVSTEQIADSACRKYRVLHMAAPSVHEYEKRRASCRGKREVIKKKDRGKKIKRVGRKISERQGDGESKWEGRMEEREE